MSLDACSGCIHGSQCSKATHHPDALRISVSLANSNAAGVAPGDLILGPFAGSGTALVSARNLGRRYLGIEITPQTAEIARRRLAEASSVFLAVRDVLTPDKLQNKPPG